MNHLIIDGFSLAYRSHFAFSSLCTSKGVFSGCVYGFLTGLRARKKSVIGQRITVAWDNEAKRKKELFASYKSNRSKTGILNQIGDLKEMLCHLNVRQAEYPGEEADDVIAALVKNRAEGETLYILTSDKDLLQLVKNGSVIVVRPKAGATEERFYDEEMVKKEFGVGTSKISCYLAFRGDVVDAIPGLPRVRSSVIAKLVEKYGSVQSIYEHISEEKFTDFEHAAFRNFESQALLNHQLTELNTNLIPNIREGYSNPEIFKTYLDKYEIKSLDSQLYTALFDKDTSFQYRTSDIEIPSLFEQEPVL